jgi:hypothetical protein
VALGTVQQIVNTGLAAVYSTPNSSETIIPADDLILHVKNASGSAITVTLTDPTVTAAGSQSVNPTISVPATTGDRFIYIQAALANPATGLITVAFSSTTSVTAALLRM